MPGADEQLQVHRVREFRCLAETAVRVVERAAQVVRRGFDEIDVERANISVARDADIL